jgi:hypothetical protein
MADTRAPDTSDRFKRRKILTDSNGAWKAFAKANALAAAKARAQAHACVRVRGNTKAAQRG